MKKNETKLTAAHIRRAIKFLKKHDRKMPSEFIGICSKTNRPSFFNLEMQCLLCLKNMDHAI